MNCHFWLKEETTLIHSSIFFLIILGTLALTVLWAIGAYNSLVKSRNEVKNAWSQIDVQLKRRYDMIPNLVEIVKGYMSHEQDTLENVTKARQQAIDISDDNVAAQAQAENQLSQTLRSLFAVSENYPDLKANTNFLSLQEELASTENRIGFARQFYNDTVMKYNNRIEIFPNNIVAATFSFKTESSFELSNVDEREAPQISFS